MGNNTIHPKGSNFVQTGQPGVSKITWSQEGNKDFEYFKLVLSVGGDFSVNDIEAKTVEYELVVGVEENFNWSPLRNILNEFCKETGRVLRKQENYAVNYKPRFRIELVSKTPSAVVLNENNFINNVNKLFRVFCFRFNSVIGGPKNIYTPQFNATDLLKDTFSSTDQLASTRDGLTTQTNPIGIVSPTKNSVGHETEPPFEA